jgi:hypothetical protein
MSILSSVSSFPFAVSLTSLLISTVLARHPSLMKPSTLAEVEEHYSHPAVHRKEVGLVVVGHIRRVAAHIVRNSEEVVHTVHDSEAVHNHPVAGRSLAEEDHHSHLEEVRRHSHPDHPGLVADVLVSHP